jgi:hypothetical protein
MHARRLLLALPLLVAGAAPARADRYLRGLALYQYECTGCHSVGWNAPGPQENNRIDLTRLVDRRKDDDIRAYLEDPRRQKSDSGCNHHGLSREQMDDLINFFHARANTPPTPPKAPTNRGGKAKPPEAPKPSKPRTGRDKR